MSRNRSLLLLIVLYSIGAVFTAARAESGHLSLDDADELARQHVIKQLQGNTESGNSASSMPPLPSIAGLGSLSASLPGSISGQAKNKSSHDNASPVAFVGAFHDAGQSTVLYQYKGAIYPAKQGATLFNGWRFEKTEGFTVSVSYHGKSWTEPILGNQPEMVSINPPLDALTSLSTPLPLSGASPVVSIPPAPRTTFISPAVAPIGGVAR